MPIVDYTPMVDFASIVDYASRVNMPVVDYTELSS
jgi:hypothetical protein